MARRADYEPIGEQGAAFATDSEVRQRGVFFPPPGSLVCAC